MKSLTKFREIFRGYINKKVAAYTIVFTLFVTIISTGIQLYSEYKVELTQIDVTFEQIRATYSGSLAQSLWNFDQEQTQLLLDGILNIPDIAYAVVTQQVDEAPIESGLKHLSNYLDATYDIYHSSENILVGVLSVQASLDGLNNRIQSRAYNIFLVEGISTLIVAFFILYILDVLVIQHLRKLSSYTATLELGEKEKEQLSLDRKISKYNKQDEFSQLVTSINSMHSRIDESFATILEKERELIVHKNHLEELVKQRTKKIEDLQAEMVAAAHGAGMAEVASGVLHKIGNILNSVGAKSSDVRDALRKIHIDNLAKSVALISDYSGDYNKFFSNENKGQKVIEYINMFIDSSENLLSRIEESMTGLCVDIDKLQGVVVEQEKYINVSANTHISNISDIVANVISSSSHAPLITSDIDSTMDMELDPHKLALVVDQLLNYAESSAINEVDVKQRIHVEVKPDVEHVVVRISNDNLGYTSDDLANIFNMNFRLGCETSNPLHDCANAAKQLGGTFDVLSEGVKLGATFVLTIPIRRAAAKVS